MAGNARQTGAGLVGAMRILRHPHQQDGQYPLWVGFGLIVALGIPERRLSQKLFLLCQTTARAYDRPLIA
jgi:hypothetical protein